MVTHDEWHRLANEKFRSLNILDGTGYTVERKTAEGQRLHIRFPNVEPGKGGGSSVFTLFQVVKDSDTSVKINGYNTESGRYSHNYIILGLSRIELADGASVADIAASGVIYLEITYSSGYSVTAKFAASLPAQDNTHIYHYLADIVCANGKISQIIQPPTSIIHFPGRAG